MQSTLFTCAFNNVSTTAERLGQSVLPVLAQKSPCFEKFLYYALSM
jgi:hypothetical protein